MFKRKQKKLLKYALIIIVIVILCFALSVFLKAKRELPVYVGENETETPMEYYIDTEQVKSGNITMEIPSGWTYVNNNGTDRYIDAATQSYIDIITQDYYPQINTFLSENIVASRISSIGGIKTGFNGLSSSCVAYTYQKTVGNTAYNIYSYISWDFKTVNEVDICIPAMYYEEYINLPEYLSGKINCLKTQPISEDYYVYFEPNTNTQFGVPLSWNFENNGQIILSSDNASIVIGTSSLTSFSGMTSLQYNQITGSSVSGFVLSSFVPQETCLTAEAFYNNNGTKMYMKQYMVNAGNLSLVFTLTAPSAQADSSLLSVFDTVTGYFSSWN